MNNEEFKKKFYANVAYLQRNIPPDDIYLFAEETFMAAYFFILKMSDFIDLEEECEADPVFNKWLRNIANFHRCREDYPELKIDLNLNSIED